MIDQRPYYSFFQAAQKVDPTKWRDLMPLTRDVARKLRSEGLLEICQRGTVVMSDAWTGPIRLRLASHKLTTGKPCQSASSTEALGAGVGSRSGSPPVALEVAKKRCGVKRPKDSGDGQGTKLRLSVSYGNSLVVKKRDGAKHSQD